MKKLILAAIASLFLAGTAKSAIPPLVGFSQPSNGAITEYISGIICLAASSNTAGTCTITISGSSGTITTSTITVTNIYTSSMTLASLTVTTNTFSVNGTTLVVVGSGNVGVSSGAPTERLGVNGNINVSGVYKVGGASGLGVTCSAGNYIQSISVVGGIITAGNCTPAGIGDVTQIGNNNFTGVNTWSKTGPGYVFVASATISNTGSVTFPSGVITSSVDYYAVWDSSVVSQVTKIQMQFNNDGGANYSGITRGFEADGTAQNTAQSGTTQIDLIGTGSYDVIAVNKSWHCDIYFGAPIKIAGNNVMMNGKCSYQNNVNSQHTEMDFSGQYSNTVLTSVTFFSGAGNWSGTIAIYKALF